MFRLEIAALVSCLALACSGTHERPGATLLPPAAASLPSEANGSLPTPRSMSPSGTGSAPSAARADAAGVGRSSPMQTLSQMLTAQALLVSLLLAPVSKDVGQGPLARLEQPAP